MAERGERGQMHDWWPRLEAIWFEHREGVVGVLLGSAITVGLFLLIFALGGTITWRIAKPHPIGAPIEGAVAGLISSDDENGSPAFGYVRTTTNHYGMVFLPDVSDCHIGDHIFLTEWSAGDRFRLSIRPPGCVRHTSSLTP